jgi:hypothetical protein
MKTSWIVAAACALGIAVGVTMRPHVSNVEPAPAPAAVAADELPREESAPVDSDATPAAAETPQAPAPPQPESRPFQPVPPTDPKVREKLSAKYSATTPEEMRAAYDSLSEVLEAHLHQRIQNKSAAMNQAQITALEDELGWLAERARH